MTAALTSLSTTEAIDFLNDQCPRAVRELAKLLTFSPHDSLAHLWQFGYVARRALVDVGALSIVGPYRPTDWSDTHLTPFFFELVKAAHVHTA